MNIETEIFQTIVKLPDSLKKELLNYAEYLLEKHKKTESSQEEIEQVHGYGSWAGQIIMSDDFDQPLEDMKEYINL
jgi:galactose-1-phosphate uridylyltransferase